MGVTCTRKRGAVTYIGVKLGCRELRYLASAVILRSAETMVPLLLEYGADLNAADGAAFQDVVRRRKAKLAEMLLAAGADVGHITDMLGSLIVEPDMKSVLAAAGLEIQ